MVDAGARLVPRRRRVHNALGDRRERTEMVHVLQVSHDGRDPGRLDGLGLADVAHECLHVVPCPHEGIQNCAADVPGRPGQ